MHSFRQTSRVLRIRVQLPENYRRPSSISVDETSFPASDFGSITHFCMIDAGRWHVCFGGIKHREVEAILDGSGGATVVNMAQCEWDFEKTQRGPHNTGYKMVCCTWTKTRKSLLFRPHTRRHGGAILNCFRNASERSQRTSQRRGIAAFSRACGRFPHARPCCRRLGFRNV